MNVNLPLTRWLKNEELDTCLHFNMISDHSGIGEAACFSIASTIASNNNKIVNIIADQMIKDNLRIFSSPNLRNSVSSTQHVATSNHLNSYSKKDFTDFGDQKLLRKAIINMPTASYFQLDSSANCIDSFLQFI